MKILSDSAGLAKDILEASKSQLDNDKTLEGYQRRYLYSLARGCYLNAQSYLVLHESGHRYDLPTIARAMLERDINSIYASKSPEHAVSLLIHESDYLVKRSKALKKLVSSENSAGASPYDSDLGDLKELIGEKLLRKISLKQRFNEVQLEDLYVSAYFRLSGYIHGDFASGVEQDIPESISELIACVSPLNTAFALGYHCKVSEKFGKRGNTIREQAMSKFSNVS